MPALVDVDFPFPPIFANFPALPDFPLETIAGPLATLGFILVRDDVAANGAGDTAVATGVVAIDVVVGFEILFVRLAVRLTGTTAGTGGTKRGGGRDGLLSNNASGTLETVNAIDELL